MSPEPAVYEPSTKIVVAVADALKIPLEKAFRILLDLHDAGVEVRLNNGPIGSTADEASARRAERSPEYRAKRAEREGEQFDGEA